MMSSDVPIARRIIQRGFRSFQRRIGRTHGGKRLADLAKVDPPEHIEQRAMPRRRQQPAVVMLAMYLHQPRTELAQQSPRNRLVVDESPAFPVGLQGTPHYQRLAVVGIDVVGSQYPRGVCVMFKCRRNTRLRRPLPHQPACRTIAQRKPQRIEQDRFPRAGLARDNNEAGTEFEVESLDQDYVANG